MLSPVVQLLSSGAGTKPDFRLKNPAMIEKTEAHSWLQCFRSAVGRTRCLCHGERRGDRDRAAGCSVVSPRGNIIPFISAMKASCCCCCCCHPVLNYGSAVVRLHPRVHCQLKILRVWSHEPLTTKIQSNCL